ncbi:MULTISPECIES: DUF6474 family protein [Amycolatopsis]|uniref:Uncharacterized protein n=3 Tax=Amycolatopsis TaxID=1813 RepID=A0A229SAG4_9PSEU|nr:MULTISPECIES: DUF6474 family protein [Amycolatopsis]OXM51423.1 hypothetical protein CFP75_13295 [Amycolatopsis alba DSM 44262]OXM55932.1 hypothetical protein CFP71_15725 [Amycolatopsis thailandensis]
MARKAKAIEGEGRITPKKAKNAVAVAKVLGPAVLPVIAPYAVRAAGAARELYDRYQAKKLGVAVDQLGEFSGRGAALHARIAGLTQGLAELKRSAKATDADAAFAKDTQGTLEQLSATVRASERMPAARRKAAHRAVAGELDQLEGKLLHRLGI